MRSIFRLTFGAAASGRCARFAAAVVGVSLALTGASEARTFEGAFGEAMAGGVACYVRTYDTAHLRANPRQQVTFIAVKASARKQDGGANRPNDFELLVGLKARGRKDLYVKTAYCKPDGNAARCGLESDGGEFRLQAGGDGSLRVDTGGGEIRIEGERDFLEVGGRLSDDNVFRLSKARPEACAELD
jgi:hypothetical protein